MKPCAIMRKCSRLVAWWPGGLRIRENPSVSESVDSPWSYSRAPGAKLISRESQVKRPPSSEFEALRRSNHRDDTLQYSDNTDQPALLQVRNPTPTNHQLHRYVLYIYQRLTTNKH